MLSRRPTPAPVLCLLCGKGAAFFWFSKDDFAIRRCARCGFVFVHPAPPDTRDIYAGEDYFRGTHRGFGYINYEEDKIPMEAFERALLTRIERLLGRRGALLDVGAATGFFLSRAREAGWEVAGIEISPYAAETGRQRGLDIRCGALGDRLFHRRFDVVTLFDVAEHLPDPHAAIRACRDLLVPGGLLVINTPDTSSFVARLLGRRWYSFVPPEHLSYFNPRNIELLLRRHGFAVEEVGKTRKRFTLAFVFYMLFRWQRYGALRQFAEMVGRTKLGRLAVPLGVGDNFFVIARRRDGGA